MSVTRPSCAALLLLASSVSCGLDAYGTGAASSGSGEAPVESAASSGGAVDTSSSGAGGSGGAGGAGGSGGGGMPSPPFCDPDDPALLACFRFENNTNDESGKGNEVSASGVTISEGKEGLGADFHAGSQVAIADADHWDVTEYTLELWYYQRSHAGDGYRMGLFDSNGRYGLFVYNQGELRCTRGGPVAQMANMPLDTWIHAACVFRAGALRLYVNGTPVAEVGAPELGDGDGTNAIGSDAPSGDSLDGLIDNVRVWNVARSESHICKAAGKPDC
ncbi:LamG domain-containing protein [Polyangium aurulentum]|uniref:LamG domain-containing protein n=1 Tax=Polyangium aurulentum TaxID=2567896 RepID=UPI0010ADB234|nr:LamG domain-containing protein [Polyangium aurulentum]UQA55779.1 LamG domain-containing protein [Polyangium aurulentum]